MSFVTNLSAIGPSIRSELAKVATSLRTRQEIWRVKYVRLRHAIVLALVGWCLMIPPPLPGAAMDVKAPLSRWICTRCLNTTAECEEVRRGTVLEAQKEVRKADRNLAALPDSPRPLSEAASDLYKTNVGVTRFAIAAASAQCVEMGDPRLKGK
jgi:hypothetical protein